MTSSLYLDRGTALHRMHPTTKLAAVGACFVAVFSIEDPRWLWPVPLLLLAAVAGAGCGANLRRMRPLLIVLPLGSLLLWSLFFRGGTPLFVLGPLRPSVTGAAYGLGMAFKLLTFLLLNLLLISASRVEELTVAVTRLGVPYRAGFALTLAFRLVPVFVESAATVLQAQRLRTLGDDPSGWLERARRTAPVIVPVFMGALRRADQMAIALEMRGFGRVGPRRGMLELRFGWPDVALLAVAGSLLAAAVVIRASGAGLVRG